MSELFRFLRAMIMLTALALALPGADLTGKWSGTLERAKGPVMGQSKDVHFATFTQKGEELTGTAGPKEDVQWNLSLGKVAGNHVTFIVAAPGGKLVLAYDMELKDGVLSGTVEPRSGQDIGWKVELRRAK